MTHAARQARQARRDRLREEAEDRKFGRRMRWPQLEPRSLVQSTMPAMERWGRLYGPPLLWGGDRVDVADAIGVIFSGKRQR